MKNYSINFFFPTQPGGRQEVTIRQEATNLGTAFARAWRQLKSMDKYKGRKGLDNCRIGVALIRGGPVEAIEAEASTES